jgi:hypothetical protein
VTLAGMRVVDRQGLVVATSREDMGLSLAAQEEVAAALAGRPVSVLRARQVTPDQPRGATSISRTGAIRVFVAQPVTEGGAVISAVLLSRTPPGVDQALHGKRWEIGTLAAALLLIAGGLALFTAYTVSRPVGPVTAQARAAAAGGDPPPGRRRRLRAARGGRGGGRPLPRRRPTGGDRGAGDPRRHRRGGAALGAREPARQCAPACRAGARVTIAWREAAGGVELLPGRPGAAFRLSLPGCPA